MNFVKIRNAKMDNFEWTEYSFLFFGRHCLYFRKEGSTVYSFRLLPGGKVVNVLSMSASSRASGRCDEISLTCNSLSLFGFTVVWRFESTLWEFIEDVWSKLTH